MKTILRLAIGLAVLPTLAAAEVSAESTYARTPALQPIPEVHAELCNYSGYPATSGIPAGYRSLYAGSPSRDGVSMIEASPAANAWSGYSQERLTASSNSYEQAMNSNWGDGGCSDGCGSACGPRWFGGVYGLMMTRDLENEVHLSVDRDTQTLQMCSHAAAMDWAGGFELRLGRVFADGCLALEAVYWGIYPDSEEYNVFAGTLGSELDTLLDFSDLDIDGTNVEDYYNDAERHRLRTYFEAHNVELNLLTGPVWCGAGCCDCQSGFHCSCNLGVRFMRINENFEFDTDNTNTVFEDAPDEEACYHIDVDNNLIGVQVGGRADYCWSQWLAMFADVKFGLFGNHMTHHTQVMGGDGTYATVNNGAYLGDEVNVQGTKNDVAFIGEARLGFNYQFSDRWRATAAYRAVALTGVALAPNQIPRSFDNLEEVGEIDSNGSLILHGAQFGVEFLF